MILARWDSSIKASKKGEPHFFSQNTKPAAAFSFRAPRVCGVGASPSASLAGIPLRKAFASGGRTTQRIGPKYTSERSEPPLPRSGTSSSGFRARSAAPAPCAAVKKHLGARRCFPLQLGGPFDGRNSLFWSKADHRSTNQLTVFAAAEGVGFPSLSLSLSPAPPGPRSSGSFSLSSWWSLKKSWQEGGEGVREGICSCLSSLGLPSNSRTEDQQESRCMVPRRCRCRRRGKGDLLVPAN